jgi:hypothetical protein
MGLTLQIIYKNDCCNNHDDDHNENLDENLTEDLSNNDDDNKLIVTRINSFITV